MEILAQSSTAFVLTHNFQGTHILGASRGRLSDSVAFCSSIYYDPATLRYTFRGKNVTKFIQYLCGELVVGSALERTSIDLALPGGVSFSQGGWCFPSVGIFVELLQSQSYCGCIREDIDNTMIQFIM